MHHERAQTSLLVEMQEQTQLLCCWILCLPSLPWAGEGNLLLNSVGVCEMRGLFQYSQEKWYNLEQLSRVWDVLLLSFRREAPSADLEPGFVAVLLGTSETRIALLLVLLYLVCGETCNLGCPG